MSDNGEKERTEQRRLMVESQIRRRGIRDPRVLAALERVPRHLFVPRHLWDQAYNDYPLPIGDGQTISQPYMVALMTEALVLSGTEKVLEVGTGSGYQAAILAELAKEVYTIERLPSLAYPAEELLKRLGYKNVHVIVGDGTMGWPPAAPYDAIIVTAGAPKVPPALVEQLGLEGRLVIPVGDRWNQTLTRIRRLPTGDLKTEYLGGCRFVKLIGVQGWQAGEDD